LHKTDITLDNWQVLYSHVHGLLGKEGAAGADAIWEHEWLKKMALMKLHSDPGIWHRQYIMMRQKSKTRWTSSGL
jgi:hypothetical protein